MNRPESASQNLAIVPEEHKPPRNLRELWTRANIAVKLLVPAALILLVILIAFPVFIAPTLNAYNENTTRLGFDTQFDRLNSRILEFLEEGHRVVGSLAVAPAVSNLIELRQTPNSVYMGVAERSLVNLIIPELIAPRIPIADLRLLSPAGNELVRIRATNTKAPYDVSPVAQNTLVSESTTEHYQAILALREGEIYFSKPRLTVPIGGSGSANDLDFQVGAPVYRQGTLMGMVVISMRPHNYLLNAFQPTGLEFFQYQTTLYAQDGTPILTADDNVTPHVKVLGDADFRAPSVPSNLLASSNPAPIVVGDRSYRSQIYSELNNAAIEGIRNIGLRLVVSKPENVASVTHADQVVNVVLLQTGLLLFGILLFVGLLGVVVVRPLARVNDAARRIAAGDLKTRVTLRSKDEIGRLGALLNTMSERLDGLIGTLEARVQERTRNLTIVADIGREVAQERDVNTLLQTTVNNIRERFNFYHAQVFLVDDAGQYAVLVTSTGEAGQKLLERKHRLEVGSASIVGQVCAQKRTFITLDTQQSEVPHRFNPILPLTRSEMALPLIVGEKLIGALDVQSVEPDAFNENDVQTFQVLADQLAIAIDNARLISEQSQRAEQIDSLNRQLTRNTWQQYLEEEAPSLGFQYDLMKTIPLDTSNGGTGTNGKETSGVETPITLRGESIGALTVAGTEDLPLSNDERSLIQAVADRVSLAIENVRLVEQSQSALTRVEQLYEATRALSSAPNIETLYDVLATQLSAYPFVDRISVLLSRPKPVFDAPRLEFAFNWDRNVIQSENPFRQQGYLPRHAIPERWWSTIDREPVFGDVERDLVDLPQSRRVFESTGIKTMVIVPMATPDRWFGGLLVQSRRTNVFTPAFAQFMSAIGDQIGIALENRYLLQQSVIEAQRNRALAEAAQIATQIGADFEIGVANLIQKVGPAAGYDHWWVGTLERAPRGILIRKVASSSANGDDLAWMDTVSLERDRNSVAEAVRSGVPVIVNNPAHDPVLAGLTPERVSSLGKHIALAVQSGETNVGALLVGRESGQADFDERDVQLSQTLSNQIAVILDNQRLFNAAQRERGTLQSILNSLPTAVIVVDADTRQPILTNDRARTLLGLDALERYEAVHTSTDIPYTPEEEPSLRVLETGEEVLSEDMTILDEDGRHTDVLVSAVPIRQGDRLVGAVSVYQDVTELREMENVLQESLRETTTLYEVSRALASENDLESILGAMAQQIYNVFVPDQLHIILVSDQDITQVYSIAQSEEGIPIINLLKAGNPFPESLLKPDETFVDSNLAENPEYSDDRKLAELGIVSLCVLPLVARAQTIGWMVVSFNSSRDFGAEERRTLRNIADQTATVAESARLAEQTAAALNTTTTLYETSLSISRSESIEAVLEVMSEQLLFYEPDEMDIFLVNDQKEPREIEWAAHWDQSMPSGSPRIDLENPSLVQESAFLEADAIFLDDTNTATLERLDIISGPLGWNNYTSYASVPMTLKGRITGRICLAFNSPFRFGRTEQQIISTLADQGAIAIDNFRLVTQTQQSLEETEILYQASRVVGNSTDLTQDLGGIVNYAVQSIATGALVVRLLSESWTTTDAAISIEANWRRSEEGVDLTGSRFTPDQFPIWPDVSKAEVVWISDLEDPNSAPASPPGSFDLFQFRSVIILPLKLASTAIGALILGSDEPWPYTERELRIYSSLADLVAISMERQRLLSQTNRRAQQLQISAQIAQSAASILNLNDLFNRTVDLIKDGFGYDHAQIFLISPDQRDARVVASTGEAGKKLLEMGHHLEVGSRSVIGQVTGTGLAQIVADITDRKSVHKPNPLLPKTRAEMALPLRARNRILGALDVQSNEPGTFTNDDVGVLSTLADQIAIAIDNAELLTTSRTRAEEMRFLFDATRSAAAIAESEGQALRNIAGLVLDNLNAASATVFLLDDNDANLVTYSAVRSGVENTIAPTYDFHTPFFEAFAVDKEPILVNDVSALRSTMQNTQQLGPMRLLRQLQGLLTNAGSVLLVPMLSGDNFVGMIGAAKLETQGFNDEAQRLMQTLASSLAALAQNARLLRQVQSANVRLLELDKLKNQFLANMSHELRTPLNSIIGFSRVILKGIDGPLTEMQEQDLQTIYESGKHLLGLVNDILDQAKIEADRMEFSNENFSMVDLIKGVMSTAVGLVKDKPIKLHQEVEPGLPNVWGDEFRTRQALLNLVSNATKFTPQGSITVSAFRTEDNGEEFVQVSVTDTGIGIPKDKLDAIFEPFQQAENSAARQYEGTGLGLPIARKLIAKQGGRLWVTSEVGIGSTFNFTMPTTKHEIKEEKEDAAS